MSPRHGLCQAAAGVSVGVAAGAAGAAEAAGAAIA
jgi:hypothetical protein